MKRLLLSSCFVFAVFSVIGQEKKLAINPHQLQKVEIINGEKEIRGISPLTAFLLLDLKKANTAKLSDQQLIEKYALIKKNGNIYANSFITIKENFEVRQLSKQGILIGTQKGNVITALIPVNKLEELAENPNINYIQIGEKATPTMDNARTQTNVNQVHAGTSLPQPYLGDGVIVGIIDIGFDYAHPNFYNSTGTTGYRVKRVWEQNATSGNPPAGYNYGRELTTESAILAAQTDMIDQSHGTHVAGIAAGSGVSTVYGGAAPNADLVFVGSNMTDPGILEGIEYIQNYAASVGKPCVINMSLGKNMGPHDGESIFDQLCDSFFVGAGKILVGAAGNSGGDNLYLEKAFTATDTSVYTFVSFPNSYVGTDGATYVDIWGNKGDVFYVAVYIYNTSSDVYEDATPNLYNGAVRGDYTHTLFENHWRQDACYLSISTGIDPYNNKPRAILAIDNREQDDNYRYVVIEIRAKSAVQTKMWASDAVFTDNSYLAPVLSGSSKSTIGEIGGTGKNIISVGAYTSKNSWNSISGGSQDAPDYTAIGVIASFSSKGPTADGRTKPDIAAPGNILASSVSRFSDYYYYNPRTVEGLNNGSNSWYYGMMEGTSMAAPMTTGIIALWLSMNPKLTPNQVKEIMRSNSITDVHTGTIPAVGDNTWGRGKINAWVTAPDQPAITPNSANICTGSSVTLNAPSGYLAYEWSNGATTPSITVNAAGSYKVKVTNNLGLVSAWSDAVTTTLIPSPPVPTITQIVDTLISSASTGNQWYKDGAIINGATGQKYTVTSSGSYKVVVSNSNNCTSESAAINTNPTAISAIGNQAGISIYPNPTSQFLNIKFDNSFKNLTYNIYDNSGKMVLSDELYNVSKGNIETIDLSGFPSGVYNVRLFNDETNYTLKITVVH